MVPRITVQLPSVLEDSAGGRRTIELDAQTVASALSALIETAPALAGRLFDESGDFRQHVLCFHNQTNTRWLESLDTAVEEGDTITILQAVSGG